MDGDAQRLPLQRELATEGYSRTLGFRVLLERIPPQPGDQPQSQGIHDARRFREVHIAPKSCAATMPHRRLRQVFVGRCGVATSTRSNNAPFRYYLALWGFDGRPENLSRSHHGVQDGQSAFR
jgi:hypothetical protein